MANRRRTRNAEQRGSAAGKLLQMMAMRHIPQALHVVAVLGIADLLADGPKNSEELAQATGTHSDCLYRIMMPICSRA